MRQDILQTPESPFRPFSARILYLIRKKQTPLLDGLYLTTEAIGPTCISMVEGSSIGI
jgi:hypothetical protein